MKMRPLSELFTNVQLNCRRTTYISIGHIKVTVIVWGHYSDCKDTTKLQLLQNVLPKVSSSPHGENGD